MEELHKGHRDRLRKRMLEKGLDHFEKHEVLELLLFHAVPRRDTNELSHRLINTFGSFSGVLDAPYEELLKVKGMGPTAAALLKMTPQILRVYLCDQTERGCILDSSLKLGRFLVDRYVGCRVERTYLLCLDNTGRLMACRMLSEGSLEQVPVIPRQVAEEAMRTGATAVVLAHNHPNGFALPSSQDIQLTKHLYLALRGIGITLADHIIVSKGDDFYSMADAGVLPVRE